MNQRISDEEIDRYIKNVTENPDAYLMTSLLDFAIGFRDARAELAKRDEIISKLKALCTVSKDGEVVGYGQDLWCPAGHPVHPIDLGIWWCDLCESEICNGNSFSSFELYSTEAAALAALSQKPSPDTIGDEIAKKEAGKA